jgi:hypothetical protein
MAIDAIKPVFGQAHRFDAFLQNDLLCRLGEALVGQPAPMRLRPGAPVLGIDPLVAQQEPAQLLACRSRRSYRRLPRAEQTCPWA